MQFQHPELLYALFLLIIPLIVHLFRLRRFQKEDFTNVKFLKKVIQETRKSSRLKKFLVLITRLLLITCLVLAFAQPFIQASNKSLSPTKTIIYLDNSFSLEATRNGNSLLQSSINELLENLKDDRKYDLFTNNNDYFGLTTSDLKRQLQEIEFTDKQARFKEIKLKAENYFKNHTQTENELILISDFQQSLEVSPENEKNNFETFFINKVPEDISNVSIDSAFVSDVNPENLTLNIEVSANSRNSKALTISVFDDEQLLGRNTLEKIENGLATISFRLKNKEITNVRIEIEDSGLRYDNKLFFSISEKQPVKTVIISDSEDEFLSRIYNEPEFETSNFNSNQIDFNKLNAANLIVLNEIESISSSLINNLSTIQSNGVSVIIIPPVENDTYSEFLSRLGLPDFENEVSTERLITGIVYDHPLLQGVFEKRTENFEYPKVQSSYNSTSGNQILKYQDGKPFLIGNNSAYLFTAALNSENSNFTNSPLIVPVLYQIGLNALKSNNIYYQTGKENKIDIPVKLGKDQVLHIKKAGIDIIPQQQNYSNRVEINTNNIDLDAGNYTISSNSGEMGNISFNYDRSESDLRYSDLSAIEGSIVYDSISEYFSESNAASQINALWKWFVIFALIFLAIEMLLIKFFK